MFELFWVSGGLLIMAIVFWVCAVGIKASERRAQKEMLKAEGVVVSYEAVGRRRSPRHGFGYHTPIRQYVLQNKSSESKEATQSVVNKHRVPLISIPPVVSIVIDGNTIECVANCKRIRSNIYPVGTKLNVLYRKKAFPLVGIVYDIRIDEEGLEPVSMETFAVIFRIISIIIFSVAAAIAIIWINNN